MAFVNEQSLAAGYNYHQAKSLKTNKTKNKTKSLQMNIVIIIIDILSHEFSYVSKTQMDN